MKRSILLITLAVLSSVGAKAQDMGFETWAPTPAPTTSEDPVGWASFNALTFAGMQRTVFKETAAPHAGSITAKIVTEVIPSSVMIPNPFNPSEDLDTVGILSIGAIQMGFPPTVYYGKPYAWRPAVLSFACKYTPMPTDSAYVVAYLTKWNGTSRDTVAAGVYQTGATTTTYTVENLNMTYDPAFATVMPDTQIVFISSSKFRTSGAKKGSTFYIDALVWSGYVSSDDISGEANTVSVFPNPAVNEINLNSSVDADLVRVNDITGRTIGTYRVTNKKVNIQTDAYAPGFYIYTLYRENTLIHKGKFEITK
jgi:hypothetical protein